MNKVTEITEITEITEKSQVAADAVLESALDIEDLISYIQELESKLEELKDLDKHRRRKLLDKTKGLEAKVSQCRQVILNTMRQADKKNLHFPGVGKVGVRKTKKSWSVDNESTMMNFLEQEGLKKEIVKTKEVTDKRKLNSALDFLDKRNKTVPGVSLIEGKEGISISYEDKKINIIASEEIQSDTVDFSNLETLEL